PTMALPFPRETPPTMALPFPRKTSPNMALPFRTRVCNDGTAHHPASLGSPPHTWLSLPTRYRSSVPCMGSFPPSNMEPITHTYITPHSHIPVQMAPSSPTPQKVANI